MKIILNLRSAVCTAALLTANSALADVTAEQVWENWQQAMTIYGQDGVTIGDVTTSGGQVTVSNVAVAMNDGDAEITADIGEIVFTEAGDGTVDVTMQESYVIAVDVIEDNTQLDITVTQENMAIKVSGDVDSMDYDVSADSYAMNLGNFRGDAADMVGEALFKIHTLAGSYQSTMDDGLNTTYAFTSSAVDMLADFKEPDGDGYFVFSGKMDGLASTGQIQLPEGADLANLDDYTGQFSFAGQTDIAGSGFILDVDIDGDAGSGTTQTGAMSFASNVTPESMSYDISMADVDFTMASLEMPVPVDVSLALLENVFSIPVVATEEAVPFAYNFTLNDLVVNDEIWAMGDPTGAIPRDPATIVFDISGMARMFMNVTDPDSAMSMAFGELPGELMSLAVNKILLSAAGAEITADGAFTFDNEDTQTFEGFPRPEGELNVGIIGANGLIDTLISMGVLPQEQATMGRMMMGMFTQPAGDDALTSKIEVKEDGQVLANGQRIR